MREYLIGTGGWAYFHIPGLHSLKAYSRSFNFVEVNSTFYKMPQMKQVERWRRIVPHDFQFSVRAHRTITHKHHLRATSETLESFKILLKICEILRAEIAHLQTPPSLKMEETSVQDLKDLLSSVNLGKIRIALEPRGTPPSRLLPKLVKTMQDHDMIHCVDLSRDEAPTYQSDILYSRLFGKGQHNIYQPTDQELKEIDRKATSKKAEKVVLGFHFVRMYKDAARLKLYKQTGKFPQITESVGLLSLEQVLREDAEFPAEKHQLIHSQGWKLIDLTRKERIHAKNLLQKLPEKKYNNINEVIQTLQSSMK